MSKPNNLPGTLKQPQVSKATQQTIERGQDTCAPVAPMTVMESLIARLESNASRFYHQVNHLTLIGNKLVEHPTADEKLENPPSNHLGRLEGLDNFLAVQNERLELQLSKLSQLI